MKKITSIVLMVMMLFSLFITVSASSLERVEIQEDFSTTPDNYELEAAEAIESSELADEVDFSAKTDNYELEAAEAIKSTALADSGVPEIQHGFVIGDDVIADKSYGLRALNTIDWNIEPNSSSQTGRVYSLEAGETITITCSYSPRSSSMRFGIIEPDGTFRYVSSTSGSVNHSFEIRTRGKYSIKIVNNSNYDVSVTGYINY